MWQCSHPSPIFILIYLCQHEHGQHLGSANFEGWHLNCVWNHFYHTFQQNLEDHWNRLKWITRNTCVESSGATCRENFYVILVRLIAVLDNILVMFLVIELLTSEFFAGFIQPLNWKWMTAVGFLVVKRTSEDAAVPRCWWGVFLPPWR